VTEVFLYEKRAGINSMHLKALRDAGYITVGVDDLSAVKIMVPPIAVPMVQHDLLMRAACEAIIRGGNFSKQYFGEEVAKALLATPPALNEELSDG
jgi:hypothetical protein